MNWQTVTFDWNQIRAFLATVEEGSLSGAARALGQTQPTLGRQVAALEDDLGIVLFERVGKSLTLTPAGRDLLIHVRTMRDAAQAISLAASGHAQEMSGTVRITASDIFAATLLPPVIARIRAAAPRLTLDIIADNAIQDLQRREADIAVRHVRPSAPELTARLVQEATAHFYAARSYIEARGHPTQASDVSRHDFVGFGDQARMVGYYADMGLTVSPAQFPVGSENGIAAWEMVRQGLGIAPMSDAVAAGDPKITRVFEAIPPVIFPVWLTTHRELHTSRRIRLVFDMLAEHFSQIARLPTAPNKRA